MHFISVSKHRPCFAQHLKITNWHRNSSKSVQIGMEFLPKICLPARSLWEFGLLLLSCLIWMETQIKMFVHCSRLLALCHTCSGFRSSKERSSRIAIMKWPMISKKLGAYTISLDPILLLPLHVICPREFCEAPFSADDDLLTAWKFELGSSQSFLRMCSGSIFASDRQQNLANCNPSTNTLWLAIRSPHAGLQAISSSTRQHFVDPQHMERVHSDTQVERILASILGHVLVASNPSCFQSFTRNVLFLPADQMYAEGEFVHPLLLHTHIVDANLRVWHSSTEPRLWVWLVLDLPITSRRPATHDGKKTTRSATTPLSLEATNQTNRANNRSELQEQNTKRMERNSFSVRAKL
jgi:hypothetical protein